MSNHDLDWLAAQQPRQIDLDDGARERALSKLVQHTTARPRRRGLALRGVSRSSVYGLGAAAVAAAVAAVVVLSSGGNGALEHSGSHVQAAVGHHAQAHATLARLADYVSASPAPSGDATLVARTTTSANGRAVTVYDLYGDNGQYFFSRDESGLAGEVSAHHNLAGGLFAREIAAAKEAATGNVQQAGENMAKAPDPNQKIDPNQPLNWPAVKAKLQRLAAGGDKQAAAELSAGPSAMGTFYDNWAWENSLDALVAGSGDPQVRTGVLRILATLPGVTVTYGTLDGQRTLVLTAGSQEVGYGYREQLTINADTGVPIRFAGGAGNGAPDATVDYKVSRVNFAGLQAESGSAS